MSRSSTSRPFKIAPGADGFVHMLFAILIVFSALGATPGAAKDNPIGEAEWRKLTNGKTVHYIKNGRVVGREYYPPGEYFSIFEDTASGTCYEGPWAFTEGRFCFLYADNFQCFAHLRRGDMIVSKSDVSGREQIIDQIVGGDRLSCSR